MDPGSDPHLVFHSLLSIADEKIIVLAKVSLNKELFLVFTEKY